MGIYKDQAIEQGYFNPTFAEEKSLAREAWPDHDPVMVGQFAKFEGEYPTNEHTHECLTWWEIPVYENNDIGNGRLKTYKAWRPFVTKAGILIDCKACWHERVIDFCRGIERVSLNYWQLDDLAYIEVPDEDREKTAGRIRQENKQRRDRGKGQTQITYTTFPKESGGTVFLHDDPDYLGGDKLPADRAELFDLVESWAMPPKGKRSAHGLGTWAKNGAKVALEDELEKSEEDKDGKSGKQAGGDKPKVKGYIYGQERWVVFKLISESLQIEFNPKRLKIPAGFKSWELAELLEAANIDYGIEGDVLTKPPTAPTAEATPESTLEPAPIYLNGILT